MDIREATKEDKQRWNEFVEANSSISFLQLWEWSEMQKNLGVTQWPLVVEDAGDIKAVALVTKRDLPLGLSWLYIPRGPVIQGKVAWPVLEEKLKELVGQEGAMFLRIDPPIKESDFLEKGWQKAEREVQPKTTFVTDLQKSEDDLLADMHSKTRYNIRLAERKGVTIRFSQNVYDIDIFLTLAQEVSERTDFHFHPDAYYKAMCQALMPSDKLEIAIAEYDGIPLAAHIIVKSGDTVTYAHGASSSQYRNVMAPYLLQWETMTRAKSEGYHFYDWFGIAPKGAGKEHSWFGITKFKKGFGGDIREYIGAYDYIKRPWLHKLFTVTRKILKKR